jgi:hypothetical protein
VRFFAAGASALTPRLWRPPRISIAWGCPRNKVRTHLCQYCKNHRCAGENYTRTKVVHAIGLNAAASWRPRQGGMMLPAASAEAGQ